MQRPTASRRAKDLGAKSLTSVCTFYGWSNVALSNWNTTHPERFDALVIGFIEYNRTIETKHDLTIQELTSRVAELERKESQSKMDRLSELAKEAYSHE